MAKDAKGHGSETTGSLRNQARAAAKSTDWHSAAKLMGKAIALHPGNAAKPGSLNHRDLQMMRQTHAGYKNMAAKAPRDT